MKDECDFLTTIVVISCVDWWQPLPDLHCRPMLKYVNRSVGISVAPPKPYTLTRMAVSDTFTTTFTLGHTTQTDGYCFEKLRLTPPEQFRRGAAWYRSRQRVVDGFKKVLCDLLIRCTQKARPAAEVVTDQTRGELGLGGNTFKTELTQPIACENRDGRFDQPLAFGLGLPTPSGLPVFRDCDRVAHVLAMHAVLVMCQPWRVKKAHGTDPAEAGFERVEGPSRSLQARNDLQPTA